MPRAVKILTTLSALAAATAIVATAAAATPKGWLSASEYNRLSAVTAALNRSASAKSIDWTRARAACASTGRATPLLKTQGASCLNTLGVLQALTNFPAQQRRCASARSSTGATSGTTTTGATTTAAAANSAVMRLMICMNPRYQALARDAKSIYTADSSARKQALLRGFSGACLATLAATPAQLHGQQRFATATVKLASDVTLLIRVTDGKAPASDFSQTRIDADVKQFEKTATAVLDESNAQRLSSCPHT